MLYKLKGNYLLYSREFVLLLQVVQQYESGTE